MDLQSTHSVVQDCQPALFYVLIVPLLGTARCWSTTLMGCPWTLLLLDE